jgi:hypothetical protein
MAGLSLKHEQQVLRALEDGPKHHIALRKALGWSLTSPGRALEGLLQRMRAARLIEPGCHKGLWQLREGVEVCSHCHGKGVVEVE